MSRIAITGATGLIGSALSESLTADGHTVHRITRRPDQAGPDDLVWDIDRRSIDADRLEGVDAVVHLAAELIDGRGEQARQRILESRRAGTQLIAETIASLDQPPEVFVSASAVGYYGDRGDEVLTEEAGPGDDFMASVCVAWEQAAQPARDAGIRTVHPRTGVVIHKDGPLIDKIELPFKLGVGGRVGHGWQYVPWISLEDEVRGLRFLIDRDLEGPVNLVGPEPVTNREMTKALGAVMRRPTVLPVPPVAVRLIYGDIAESLAMVSSRVVPQRLLTAGFSYRHNTLTAALQAAFGRRAA